MKTSDHTLRAFHDAVAIITGGASGIGRALAEELVSRGAHVVLADLQIDLAQEVAANIRAQGGKADAVEVNVTDASAVNALVQNTVERAGRLDYMFNNAGVAVAGEARDHSLDDWNYILDINLRGVIHGVQAAYPVMIAQGFGHIVNTASVAGLFPTAFMIGYSATKHAVVGLSTSLRIEAAYDGVRVSVVCPGLIRTPIMDGGKYGRLLNVRKDEMLELVNTLKAMEPKPFAAKSSTPWPAMPRLLWCRHGTGCSGWGIVCRPP